ncbi:MAG TPA: GNAT family N-acetyltransferase, partial [Vicinamibacterales bacterium]|nr:GNAT family N-acetyltransferase [Vicinamibacterales bacterium]
QEFARVDDALPLHRFNGWTAGSTYLVAWDDSAPIGHVHIAWQETELELPELQDMYVLPERRSQGVGKLLTRAAERLVSSQGHDRCSLSVSEANTDARRLYERLGYTRASVPPKRVRGPITIRGERIDVDDTLLYFMRRIGRRPERA